MNATTDSTAEALFGRTRRGVLSLLFGRPGESFYLREIVRLTGAGNGAVQRELSRLVETGLLRRDVRGRQVYFTANPDAAVYPELCRLVAKTAGVTDLVRAALVPLVEQGMIDLAFIYGSVASGTHGPGSDVDLMVVGRATLSKLIGFLRSAEQQLGREINATIYTPDEFHSRLGRNAHFLGRVLDGPKLMLVGNPDELAELAGQSLGGSA